MGHVIHLLSERQNHRCCYCGHRMIDIEKRLLPFVAPNAGTREHIEPKCWGGSELAAACRQCNELRGNMDYVAFYNLLQKWFKRDETLRERWHRISRSEYRHFKLQCLRTQERHLRGLGKYFPLFEERHKTFMLHNEDRLRA